MPCQAAAGLSLEHSDLGRLVWCGKREMGRLKKPARLLERQAEEKSLKEKAGRHPEEKRQKTASCQALVAQWRPS